MDTADTGDDAAGRDIVLGHLVAGKLRQLEEWRSGIKQAVHALAGKELALADMALARSLITAYTSKRQSGSVTNAQKKLANRTFGKLGHLHVKVLNQRRHALLVFLELGRAGVDLAVEDGRLGLGMVRPHPVQRSATSKEIMANNKPQNTDNKMALRVPGHAHRRRRGGARQHRAHTCTQHLGEMGQ